MNLDEYMSYDATGLAELVAAKEVTAKELLALARKRAQQVNGKINAIVIDVDKEADEQAAGELTDRLPECPSSSRICTRSTRATRRRRARGLGET